MFTRPSSTRSASVLSVMMFGGVILAATMASAFDMPVGVSGDPPAHGGLTREDPLLVIQFSDTLPLHNMAITSDGSFYYTVNGGNAYHGMLNTYDLEGNLVNSVSCSVNARAMVCDLPTGDLYVKSNDRNWYNVDPVTGDRTTVFTNLFEYQQSSPALTPDGNFILEHEDGIIRWLYAETGVLVDTQEGYYFGDFPSSEAVATDGERIFTWDGTLTQAYDMDGNYVESWDIPHGHYGYSLCFANGLLWTCEDGEGGTGTWYGYDVSGMPTVESATWGMIKNAYR